MTGIQKAFVFSLSASAAAGGTYGGYVGVKRASAAAEIVTQRHASEPVPFGRTMREIAQEIWSPTETSWSPTETSWTGHGFSGLDIAVPAEIRPGEAVQVYEPATVADLRREGIDLESINEIRSMMRTALTSGDSIEKLKMAFELKRRFNLEASHGTLAELERVGPGVHGASLTARGRAFVKGVVDSVVGVWDRLLAEVDR